MKPIIDERFKKNITVVISVTDQCRIEIADTYIVVRDGGEPIIINRLKFNEFVRLYVLGEEPSDG